MAEERFELTLLQSKTPGLWTGDPLEVVIDWQINCIGFWCFVAGWATKIEAKADGVNLISIPKYLDLGNWGARTTTLKFAGTMPPHDVNIWIRFSEELAIAGIPISQKIERNFTLLNNDDFPPPEDDVPPGFCTEGETRCAYTLPIAERGGADPDDLMVCSNAKWVLKEKNVLECGYVPPECVEGTERCMGTTLQRCVNERWKIEKINALECGYVPPDDDVPPDDEDKDEAKKFWDEYKWWIIGGLAVIAVAVVIIQPWKGGKLRIRR